MKVMVDSGVDLCLTRRFFDISMFCDCVDGIRARGITVPIVAGLRPNSKASQFVLLPLVFHCYIPYSLLREIAKCKDDTQVKQVGIEWCTAQSRELKARGVPSIHFYSLMAVDSVYQIAKQVY